MFKLFTKPNNDEEKKPEPSHEDPSYKKADIDFAYTIDRKQEEMTRYTWDGQIWKQKTPGTENRAVILCVGDLMCEPAMSEAAYFGGEYDFRPCFKYAVPMLRSGDLALANLETMVSERIPYAHEKYVVKSHTGDRHHCNAPVSYLDALQYAGFDGFAMANNHSADGGYDGLMDTIDNVDHRGFMRTGAFKSKEEPRFLLVEVNGIRLGILSYTEHINRDLDKELFTEEGCNVMLNRFSEEKLKQDVEAARAAGAEFILCYMHVLGQEYSHTVWQRQRKNAQLVADAGVDCIMGSHTHSIQEYEAVTAADGRRVPVIHSLGNFITSDATSMITRKSIVYKLVLQKAEGKVKIADESYIPCRVIENILSSSYKVFPTQRRYRNQPSKLLDNAQEEIFEVVGELKLDGMACLGSGKYMPEEGASYEEKRALSVGRICNITGIDTTDMDKELLRSPVTYYTNRYTWVRKGCVYFSRFSGEVEEQEARWAYERGAKILFCSKHFTTADGKPMPCKVVEYPFKKCQVLNRWVRALYPIPTIAITGSVGKTTTKEMIYDVLSTKFKTLKSVSNANSSAAVVDFTQKLRPEYGAYIQEIGAFSPGLVEAGARMLAPNMSVITNIGYPHVDLYGSIENILYDKTSLIRELPEDGVAFLNYDDERLRNYQTDKKVISFGIHNQDADYVAEDIHYGDGEITFTIRCGEGRFPAVIHMVGEHNILNALVAFAVGRYVGISAEECLKALADYRSEGMRQHVLNVGGYNLYMDCYNSAPNSVVTSIHALSLMQPLNKGKRVAVIGDIPRLGSQSEAVHRDVGTKLVGEAIELYLFYGKYMAEMYEVMHNAGCNVLHTESREQLNDWIRQYVNRDDIVLFKAGHPMALAKTVDQVFGTSFHILDGDVLLENSKDATTLDYNARWIDGVVEIRAPRNPLLNRVIPSSIKDTAVGRIGNEAFSGGKVMETLTIPGTVYNIGFAAFYNCTRLREVHFAAGLKVLERSAFNGCAALKELVLPETLIDIGERAFAFCTHLRSITIPASVGHISDDAFEGCRDLTIRCKEGSYAQIWAQEKNIRVEIAE